MKIVAAMIIFRGEPFVSYAIEGIINHVDHLIVVYGAQKEFAKLPSDDTPQIIQQKKEKYFEKLHVLTPIKKVWASETDQRNCYVEYIKKELDCDWLWVVDSDEFYTERDAKILTVFGAAHGDFDYILYPFWNFYYDFYHYTVNHLGMLKFIRWRDDLQYHESIPQVLDNIGNSKNKILWRNHNYITNNHIKCIHYNHICHSMKMFDREIMKLKGSNRRDVSNPRKPDFSKWNDYQLTEWIRSNYRWLQGRNDSWLNTHTQILTDNFNEIHPKNINEIMRKCIS